MAPSVQLIFARNRTRGKTGLNPGQDIPSPSIPIVEKIPLSIPPSLRRRVDQITRNLLRRGPEKAVFSPWIDQGLSTGLGQGPRLIIEDHSWIRLFEAAGDLAYSYRSLLLAGDGDLVVLGGRRSHEFESYCRDILQLGSPRLLLPGDGKQPGPLASRCARDQEFIASIAAYARSQGELTLVPYMGTGWVWRLAGAIAARASMPIRVAAPPPRLTRLVNNKLWFSERVSDLLGPQAHPPGIGSWSLAMLSKRCAELAQRYARIVIKLVDSASSAGNLVLDAAELGSLSLCELHNLLARRLRRLGWRGNYPLIVSAWEAPVLSSPSVHLWVSGKDTEEPVCEGIFEQLTLGNASEFIGAVPSSLPPLWQENIAVEAGAIGLLFQQLGYFGRCSLDAIIVGNDLDKARLHWVECNGRWGGVSYPLTLVNRLHGDLASHPFVVMEEAHLEGYPCQFHHAQDRLGQDLYTSARGRGVIFLSPSRIEQGSGFEIVAIEATAPAARKTAQRAARQLGSLIASGA